MHHGGPPELFKPGIPVVLEGRWQGDTYASDRIMVKHTEEYRAENPERVKDYPEVSGAVNPVVGQSAVLLGFLAAVGGIVTLAAGSAGPTRRLSRTGRTYVWLLLAGRAPRRRSPWSARLITHDFSLNYVADHGSRSTPLLYTVASLWAALEGSILLWTLVLAGYVATVTIRFRDRAGDPMLGWAMLAASWSPPSSSGSWSGRPTRSATVQGAVVADGPGPNPLLQNHPLMAYPSADALPGLRRLHRAVRVRHRCVGDGTARRGLAGRDPPVDVVRVGLPIGGIVLGAWWSYEVLGWGGFWAWDPVENASFLPWLTATAYLHSVMVQERRGMLRVWNLSLLLATFSLTILGTFLTRSGVLDSVHSFTESSIGPLLLGFFAVVVAAGIGLIGWRGDRLRSPGAVDSPLSREGAFLANNLLFAGVRVRRAPRHGVPAHRRGGERRPSSRSGGRTSIA